jgi:hypothetical protein
MGNKAVCVNCRIAFSHGMNYNNIISRICPQCKNEMVNVDYKFRAPKKNNVKKWETIKYLLENGFYFQRIYESIALGKGCIKMIVHVKYPQNIKDAKTFVEKYNSQKIVGKYEFRESNDGGKYHRHKDYKSVGRRRL